MTVVGIWLNSVGKVQFCPFHFSASVSKIVGCIVEIGAAVTAS